MLAASPSTVRALLWPDRKSMTTSAKARTHEFTSVKCSIHVEWRQAWCQSEWQPDICDVKVRPSREHTHVY